MSTTPSTNKPYTILLLPALIVAGLAGNYLRFEIFLNIDFLFGSIFAMLALQFFGFGRGVGAAALIAGYTYILWNHPYAIIIMTAEVAVVGWLMNRRKLGMVLSDALYWLVIGMPLVYVFYHVVMQVPFSNTTIVMTKQAMNGIANALVARLIFTGFALRSRSSLLSFNELICNLLAFFVVCPALILLAVGSRTDFSETDHAVRQSLIHDSHHAVSSLKIWVENRKLAIQTLAELAVLRSPQQMQSYLELAKKSDRNFLRIGLLNSNATIVAYYPLIDELGQANIGKNFADRPFIPKLKQTLKPMLSEIVVGRIGIPQPMVTMLAPVVMHGEFAGYITGILSLQQVQEHLNRSTDQHSMFYTLLDKNGRIIMTNRSDQTVMTPFVRGKGTLNHLDRQISQWVPAALSHTPISERWKKSFYVVERDIGEQTEWKLVLEQPVAPFQKKLYDTYTGKLTLLFLILIGALALAELLSRRIISTLEKLRLISLDLPARLTTNSQAIVWPESGIRETNFLISNFKEMAQSLMQQFHEVRQMNESLQQRTTELRQANESLQQAKLAAESSAVAKGRFLNTVAHEFRTPLSLLASSTDIIDRYAEWLSKEKSAEQNTYIRSAVKQLSRLIDSVLSFSRLESDRQPNVPEAVDVKLLCRTIAAEVETAWSAGHRFSMETDGGCGSMLLDKTLFRQVLENLLTNAFRYTPPSGSVSLQISLDTNHLLLVVTDTGIGIPEQEQEQIFDAFYRGSNVDARRGLGLGLSIVRESVQLMGGTLQLSSKPGEGTIMRVTLPVTASGTSEEQRVCTGS
jgi:signal transduction histidine kinase